eukprot:m.51906 g.51906  ORF g.51906 m.51906 type:complete len:330 (-) comp10763_c0_seq1:642-1631(-)
MAACVWPGLLRRLDVGVLMFCILTSRSSVGKQSCQLLCGTCAGPADDQCTSCINEYFYIENALSVGRCTSLCYEFMVGYGAGIVNCRPCHRNCYTCYGPGGDDCVIYATTTGTSTQTTTPTFTMSSSIDAINTSSISSTTKTTTKTLTLTTMSFVFPTVQQQPESSSATTTTTSPTYLHTSTITTMALVEQPEVSSNPPKFTSTMTSTSSSTNQGNAIRRIYKSSTKLGKAKKNKAKGKNSNSKKINSEKSRKNKHLRNKDKKSKKYKDKKSKKNKHKDFAESKGRIGDRRIGSSNFVMLTIPLLLVCLAYFVWKRISKLHHQGYIKIL